MRIPSAVTTTMLAFGVSAPVGGLATSAVANAALAIDGTYSATSDGQWAKTNSRYHDEATVISMWTIHTTCKSPYDCSGTVSSDRGWTAQVYTKNVQWRVDRDLPNWEPCPSGEMGHGRQIYTFSPVGPDGQMALDSTTFTGFDKTTGDSGACGKNQWLVVEMPFKLVKVA